MNFEIEDKSPNRMSVWLKTDAGRHLGLVDFWLDGDGQIVIAGNPHVLVRKILRAKKEKFAGLYGNMIAIIRVSPP